MPYKLPINGKWTQPNINDKLGSLWSTFNVDLSKKQGSVYGTRLISNGANSVALANLGLATSFARFDTGSGTQIWTVAGTRVFKSASANFPSTFSQDAISGTPTTCDSARSDIKVFNDALYVTTNSRVVYKLSGGGWTNFNAGSVNSDSHILCVFGNRMYMVTEVCKIISWNTSDTVATSGSYTMNLTSAGLGSSTENIITFLRPVSDGIWIGTMNRYGNDAKVYFWNGVTENVYTRAYELDSSGAMACVIKDDVPVIVNNDGVIGQLNGGTFVEIARFPIRNKKSLTNSFSFWNERWIHPNGIKIINGKINVLVALSQMSNSSKNEENCPSGIWEFDPEVGLYHKYSPSYYDSVSNASVTDYGQLRIAHSTGDDVQSGAGALFNIKNTSDTITNNGSLLAGFKFYTNATTTKYAIFFDDSNSTIQTYSHIISSRLPAQSLIESFNNLYASHKEFINASDKIIVKYRDTDLFPVEGTITWISTTGFTTSLDLSDYVIGDEVEILQGIWGGFTSHITQITATDSGYMVEVDETHTGATGSTCIARFQKWKKAGVVNDTIDIGSVQIGAIASAIQLKICLLFTGANELQEIGQSSSVNKQL